MGLRFQRRFQLLPWLRLNLSRGGLSASIGPRGLHLTLGRRPRVTVGLPGSGLSWTQSLGHVHATPSAVPHVCTLETGCNPSWVPVGRAAVFVALAVLMGAVAWLVVHLAGL
jgi:hypothetical protein